MLCQPMSTENKNLNSGYIVNFVLHAFLAVSVKKNFNSAKASENIASESSG